MFNQRMRCAEKTRHWWEFGFFFNSSAVRIFHSNLSVCFLFRFVGFCAIWLGSDQIDRLFFSPMLFEYKNTTVAVSGFCFVCVSIAPKIVIWLHRHVQRRAWKPLRFSMKTFECGHACEFYVCASLSPSLFVSVYVGLSVCCLVLWHWTNSFNASAPKIGYYWRKVTVWRTRNVCATCAMHFENCTLLNFFLHSLLFSIIISCNGSNSILKIGLCTFRSRNWRKYGSEHWFYRRKINTRNYNVYQTKCSTAEQMWPLLLVMLFLMWLQLCLLFSFHVSSCV